jgi:glycosyltransferase involved in cell wall biosynthesis
MATRVLVFSHLFPSDSFSAAGRFVEDQVKAIHAEGVEVQTVTVRFHRLSFFKPFDFFRGLYDGLICVRTRSGTSPRGLKFIELQCPSPRLGGVVQAWLYAVCAKRFISRYMESQSGFDLVHAHTSLLDGYVGLKVSNYLRIPLLITEHTGPFESLLRRAGSKRILTEVFTKAGTVVAVSAALGRSVVEQFPFLNLKLLIVPNTYSELDFRYDGTPPMNVIGWLGYVSPVKRIDRLLCMFAKMRQVRTDLSLKIISMNTLTVENLKLAADLRIREAITYAQSKTREDVASALRNLSLLVVSSDVETFSVACLEALAVGTPVVSTNCGGPSDILKTAEDGIVVDSNDPAEMAVAALKLLNGDLNSTGARSARAKRASDNFGAAKIAGRYVELYRDLLSTNNS